MTKSKEIFERARKVIPGGVMSNWRKDESYVPTYMSHGKGARVYDVDGNEYIDYWLAAGPAILGYGNEHLQNAVIDQIKRLHTGDSNEMEYKAAEKIVKHFPSIDLVRFTVSGTEANWNALRAARAYTKKDKFVRFNGHYHGGSDNLLGGIVTNPEHPVPVNDSLAADFYSQMAYTGGRFSGAFSECYMIEWNDLEALERLFKGYADDIAAVIMEPVMVNMSGCMPETSYLEGVRRLCSDYGVVLIFDEVLTGLRMGLSGAQGYFGVTPDMTTLAKAIGGGFPVSAFGGKKEIMDGLTRTDVVAGGTYNASAVSLAAVVATVEELEKDDGAAFKRIDRLGTILKEGLDEIAARCGQPLLLQGFPGAWTYLCTSKRKIVNHRDSLSENGFVKGFELAGLLKKKGILAAWRFLTSAAHTEADIQETLQRAEDAMKQMK